MSVEAFLMSMQAAGAVADAFGTQRQISMGRQGTQLQQEQLKTRLEEERTAAAMSALDAMKQLRSTLSTQRAMFAARGQSGGSGSALAIQAKSKGEQTEDARVRRMNLLMKEATLRSAGALTGMHQLSSETQLGQSLTQRLIDNAPITEAAMAFGFGKRKAVEGV